MLRPAGRGWVPGLRWVSCRLFTESGPLPVLSHEFGPGRTSRPATRADVTGRHLAFLNVDVRVKQHRQQVIDRVAGDNALAAPVIRQADLVDDALAGNPQRPDPPGDQHPGRD